MLFACLAVRLCFYSEDKTKCGSDTAYGPGEYGQYKASVGDSSDPVTVNVVEPISLDAPIFVGNMVTSREVIFSGNNEITGTIVIAPGYSVQDGDFTLRPAHILLTANTKIGAYGKITANQGVAELTVMVSEFSNVLTDYPFEANVYEGPKPKVSVTPTSHALPFGELTLTATFSQSKVTFKDVVAETIADVCVSTDSGCAKSAAEAVKNLPPNTTFVNMTVTGDAGVLELEDMHYKIMGSGSSDNITFDCEMISNATSLTVSDITIDFQCAKDSVVVEGPEVTLENVVIAEKWKQNVVFVNVTATPSVWNELKVESEFEVRVLSSATQITFNSNNFEVGDVTVNQALKSGTIVTRSSALSVSDNAGAVVTIVPELEDEEGVSVSVAKLAEKSTVVVDSFDNLSLDLTSVASSVPLNISNTGMVRMKVGTSKTINAIFLNTTRGMTLEADASVHVLDIEFGSKDQVVTDELIVVGEALSADTVRVGRQSVNVASNLEVRKALTMLEQSTLSCSGCTFNETSEITIVTGGKVPLPQLILSSDSKFQPKRITVLVQEGVTPRDYQTNKSIANKTPYNFITGFSDAEECAAVLKAMAKLPYAYVPRCEGTILKIYAGDAWNTPVHYTTTQIIGMVFATIIVLAIQYFITWFL